MSHLPTSFEIHVHGDVPLRADITAAQVEEALRQPGIRFDARKHILSMCWTLSGNDDFRFALDEMCVGLNEIAAAGAAIEVSFYDSDFDEEDHASEEEARDDFVILFVGPTPADIMQVQRNILVEHVTAIMEQHFDAEELGGVVGEIDKLFHQRFDRMVSSLQLGKPPRSGAAPRTGHKPRRPSH